MTQPRKPSFGEVMLNIHDSVGRNLPPPVKVPEKPETREEEGEKK